MTGTGIASLFGQYFFRGRQEFDVDQGYGVGADRPSGATLRPAPDCRL
jgi:hypothetical protein